ncbi:MAG: hypothetical protein JW829_12445 [Pirellulales bacterium]|nr:hypothetical protein [Pirellulales bacterium]
MLFPSLQVRLVGPLICLVLGTGCRMPWQEKNDVPTIQARTGSTHPGEMAQVNNRRGNQRSPNQASSTDHSRIVSSDLPTSEPTEDEAMATVMDELQAIYEIDPDAHRILMQDLHAAKPSHWPLIVHHFHAALTYRQQLVDRDLDRCRFVQQTGAQPASAKPLDHRSRASFSSERTNPSGTASVPELARSSAGPVSQAQAPNDQDPEPPIQGSLPSSSRASKETRSTIDPSPAPDLLPDNPLRAEMVPAPESPMATGTHQDSHPLHGLERPMVQSAGFQTSTTAPRSPDPFDMPTANPENATAMDPNHPLASWVAQLENTIEQLEAATTDAPDSTDEIRRHASLRMLYLIAGRREDALRPIPGISPTQQDYWSKQLFALATYMDHQGQPDAQSRATLAQSQLSEATALLGELGTLSVRNLAFCERVSGFGIYEAIEKPQFSPEERVTLYAEIENYRSDTTDQGYRTVLEASYKILDDRGQRVDSGLFPQIEDLCQSRRRDFHAQYGIKLPQRIYPGKYTLQLIVQDMLSNKIGRASTEFEIKGDR